MANTKMEELTAQVLLKLHEHVYDIESLNQWKKQMLTMINEIGEQKLSCAISINESNTSLDPVDWASARSVAHQTLNLSLDYIQYVRDRPVWQPLPNNVRAEIEDEPLPEQGQSLSSVCDDVFRWVVPYARGNIHPRFWGWVSGEGTLGGVLSDMIAATINMNACSHAHSAAYVERTVIEWMRQIFGFPKDIAGGLLVSGTSIATIIGMAAARQRALASVREDGLANGPQLIAYVSTEAHTCIQKALELLGLGSKALHLIPVDENFQIKIDDLKTAIQNDRDKGFVPFCIIGNAGKYHNENVFFYIFAQ
jgi:glutamate/tyrosine decarboxylase-like PLP-dependent enzyme